jgi:hypothetical protein
MNSRRVVWRLRRGFRSTAALVVIPKFVGLAFRAVSQHRWEGQGEKSKRGKKTWKE